MAMRQKSMTGMRWRRLAAAWAAGALAVTSAQADGRLKDLQKRKVELERMAAKCASLGEQDRGACLAKRQKELLAEYRELSEESPGPISRSFFEKVKEIFG